MNEVKELSDIEQRILDVVGTAAVPSALIKQASKFSTTAVRKALKRLAELDLVRIVEPGAPGKPILYQKIDRTAEATEPTPEPVDVRAVILAELERLRKHGHVAATVRGLLKDQRLDYGDVETVLQTLVAEGIVVCEGERYWLSPTGAAVLMCEAALSSCMTKGTLHGQPCPYRSEGCAQKKACRNKKPAVIEPPTEGRVMNIEAHVVINGRPAFFNSFEAMAGALWPDTQVVFRCRRCGGESLDTKGHVPVDASAPLHRRGDPGCVECPSCHRVYLPGVACEKV